MAFGFPASLEIFVIGVCLAGVSKALQHVLVDRRSFLANQKKMQEQQKRLRELTGKQTEDSTKEMEKVQSEMMENLNKMMKDNLRIMMFSLVVFLPAFWVLGMLYNGGPVQTPFALPVIHRDFSFEITQFPSWLWVYIYSSLFGNLALGAVLKAFKIE